MLWMAKRVVFGKTKNSIVSKLKDINYLEGSVLIRFMYNKFNFWFLSRTLVKYNGCFCK